MAMFVAKQSGDFNTAGTWNKCSTADGTALDNTTTTNFSATARTSQTFTAPDLTSQCIGGVFWARILVGWTGSFTLELMESGVQKAIETVSYTAIRFPASEMCAIYIKFTTPYTYATLTAGAYAFRLTATATGSTGAIATVGTTPGMLAVDDRTGAPGTSDDVVIVNEVRQGSDLTVTASGTVQFGGNIRTGLQSISTYPTTTFRGALLVSYGGELKADNTVTTTITINGQASLVDGGLITFGTLASPITFTNPLLVEFSKAQPNGLWHHRGILSVIGTARDVRRIYASGAGTGADPLIIDAAANWAVDDEIVVTEVGTSGTNYNNAQYRFIKTVNSTTSFVVSSTIGGAEAALTNTRTYAGGNSHIVCLNRSIRIMGKSGTGATTPVWIIQSNTNMVGSYVQRFAVDTRHARLEDVGQTDFSAKGSSGTGNPVQHQMDLQGIVLYACTSTTTFRTNNAALIDSWVYADITFAKATATVSAIVLSTALTTMNSFNLVDLQRGNTTFNGFVLGALNDWVIACQNKDGSGGVSGLTITMSGGNALGIVNNMDIYSSRGNPVNNSSATLNPEFFQCKFGVRGNLASAFAVAVISSGPPTYMTDCQFQSGLSHASGTGSYLGIANMDLVTRKDKIYDYFNNIIAEATGAGLPDTTVRTASSYAVRAQAALSNAAGGNGFYSFFLIAEPNKAVSVFGFAKKAAALVGLSCVVRITLPFATSHAAEFTLTDDTNWNLWSVSTVYTGTLVSLARVDIIVPYAASGYLYLDDIYNGTNPITALDLMYRGTTSPVMSNTIGDPNAVWQVLQNAANTTGTFGAALQNAYQAKVWLADDNGATNDRYVAAWFKNGAPITSGVTSPTIQVVKASDGSDLIASTAMSALGSTGAFKYDTASNRIVDGSAYLVIITSTIDGATRTWMQPVSRDS